MLSIRKIKNIEKEGSGQLVMRKTGKETVKKKNKKTR